MLGYKMLILSLPDHQTINIIVNKKNKHMVLLKMFCWDSGMLI